MQEDATSLAQRIREGTLTASAAMEAALGRAGADPFGAVSWQDPAYGRAQAAAFDALPGDGLPGDGPADGSGHDARRCAPFAGLPTLAKDLGGPFARLPVAAGSRLFARPAGPAQGSTDDSDLAQRFRAAGLLPFGLTTTPEFGLSLASEPACGPRARNPLNPALSPGGSSGGAAAAVASGIVALAHATDAGGSIRVPAACCGLIGLKPGRGSLPGGPGFTNHLGGIASEFALCRSVRDAATLFSALRGASKGPCPDPTFRDAGRGGLRIGVLTRTAPDTAAARAAAVDAAAQSLAASGHQLQAVSWTDLAAPVRASDRAFRDIVSVNLAALVATLGLDPDVAEPMTRAVIARGQRLGAATLWNALEAMPGISHALWRIFDRIDILLCPMLSDAPRPLGWHPMSGTDTEAHFAAMAEFAPLATLANASGFAALTLPFGADAEGLPLPVQMIAPFGAEPLLLSLAASLEAEGRWHHPFDIAKAVP